MSTTQHDDRPTILLLLTARHASCEHLRGILKHSSRWRVVAEPTSPRLAETEARDLRPVLVLVASDLPPDALADAVQRISLQSPESRVALFSRDP